MSEGTKLLTTDPGRLVILLRDARADANEMERQRDEAREHCELMANLLMAYVHDEDRFLKEDGEPYGSISTDVGIMARAAVRQYAKK